MFSLKELTLKLCYLLLLIFNNNAEIVIRKATKEDLPALFELDKLVSYEYFLPIYSEGYSHLPLGQNPQYYLDLELEQDKTWFPECITENTAEFLWVAYDQNNNTIAGLIIAHQLSKTEIEIDLLLILKKYRRQGIGRKLIHHAIRSFPYITSCKVYPLKYNNNQTLSFYESIGFINYGAPQTEKLNLYGIPYKDMYYHFKLSV